MPANAPLTIDEMKQMMRVLGRAEGEFAASITAALFWVVREGADQFRVRNGTAFFLDAGEGLFGVTANHVLDGWRGDTATQKVVSLQLGALQFEPEGRNSIIDAHADLDIATFRISVDEVRSLKKTVLTGYQGSWPPPPPQEQRGIYFAGFPGQETMWVSPRDISFGISTCGGVASSVSDLDVSSLIDREHIIPTGLGPMPPENYDFRGISGGPMISVIEHRGLRTWALAGVIYQGPNTSPDPNEAIAGLELIRARRAHFIKPDGTLDTARWQDFRYR